MASGTRGVKRKLGQELSDNVSQSKKGGKSSLTSKLSKSPMAAKRLPGMLKVNKPKSTKFKAVAPHKTPAKPKEKVLRGNNNVQVDEQAQPSCSSQKKTCQKGT